MIASPPATAAIAGCSWHRPPIRPRCPFTLTNESADKVDTYGAYGRKGTTLQVRGTFNLACPDHDGASDLHAQVVTVTEKGKATPDEFDINAFIPGVVTVMIGLAMMVVFYLLRERQR